MLAYLLDKFFIKKPRFRRVVTRTLYGSRELTVNVLGTDIRINALLENGYYRAARMSSRSSLLRDEIPVIVALANLVGPNTTFVDIGANVGIFSVQMARFQRLYPGFSVLAFEVNPSTFKRLEQNAAVHGFRAVCCGIGSMEERVEFVTGAVSHVTTRLDMANKYSIRQETFNAVIRPLASFDINGALIMKVDVEGQEFPVLEGGKRYFQEDRVDAVYLDGYQDQRCWDFLESFEFCLLDARTLMPASRETFSLLAIRKRQ